MQVLDCDFVLDLILDLEEASVDKTGGLKMKSDNGGIHNLLNCLN